jgi:hypothetical protein
MNLKILKEAIKQWLPMWWAKKHREILEIEANLSSLQRRIDEGALDKAQLEELKRLEERKAQWLKKEEQEWR